MTDRWLGWHFLPADRRLRGSREVVKAGRTYRFEGPLALCSHGMHASRRALDALTYAPGPVVCRVELLGERLDAHFKSCARERRVLWIVDATRVLHEFALAVATDALRAADARGAVVDPRARAAIETKRRWLRGEATDAALAAAEAAAWAATEAASEAATEAASEAATEAARAAAEAASEAATEAARAAADAAAGAAAWAAEAAAAADAAAVTRDAQNTMLEAMLESLEGSVVIQQAGGLDV